MESEILTPLSKTWEKGLKLLSTKRQILILSKRWMTPSRWNWMKWQGNSKRTSLTKMTPGKLWSCLKKIWRTCTICSWVKVETTTRMTLCSRRSLLAEHHVQAVLKTSSTCTVREWITSLGENYHSEIHLKELPELAKASPRCCQWSTPTIWASTITKGSTQQAKKAWIMIQTPCISSRLRADCHQVAKAPIISTITLSRRE